MENSQELTDMADNEFSQPSLIPPSIPPSFEADAGTSKTDFALAIFELLKKSQITGITQSSPNPLDITQLATDLTALEARVTTDEAGIKTYRKVFTSIVDGSFDVTFPSLGGTNYEVSVIMNTNVPEDAGIWSITAKTDTSVRVRVKNVIANPNLEITIRQAPASL